VRFAGLTVEPTELRLTLDGQPLDTAVNGRELWQVDREPTGPGWTLTINLPASAQPRRLLLEPQKGTGR
jgi:hypothetical protein